MRNRRLAQVSTSDDEEEQPPPSYSSSEEDVRSKRRRRGKNLRLSDEEEEEDEEEEASVAPPVAAKEPSEGAEEDAKPVGEVVRVSGKGRGRRRHYSAFEYNGNQFELEMPVLLVPEDVNQKPYVAIIKDISQTTDGSVMVTGQWFYRPGEAEKRGGGSWPSSDTRELFYSFHRDEVPGESVMHKCVVHFIPLGKQIPKRKEHPGFIVQRVYDTIEKKLWKLTDKDYADDKQHEIDVLVQKTQARLGELPNIETEDSATEKDREDLLRTRKMLRRKNVSPIDVTRENGAISRSDQHLRAETPGSCTSNPSEYLTILKDFKALTGESQRDKCLEKLLQAIQSVCNNPENGQDNCQEKDGLKGNASTSVKSSIESANGSQEKMGVGSFRWPDAAVPAVIALEKASHNAYSSDFQKYNQKMRQLVFNLKNNSLLARRLLNGELEPSKILNMSPNELKEGMTADEIATKEPEESERMQMTDARCRRCMEKKVGLIDIIQTGHGDRYQLECTSCGNNWYASRDEASTLTIDEPSNSKSVGTAPLATAKFEDVEKKLVSPREPDETAGIFKKTTEAYMPVLEKQKSFGKPRTDDNSTSAKNVR